MNKILKTLLFTVLALNTATANQQEHSPKGFWLNGDKKGVIEVYSCGDKMCGKLVSLKEPIDPDTRKPKLDKHNPDPALQTRPLQGLEIMKGFKKVDNNSYEDGEIYDPKEGKTYSAEFTMKDANTMDLRGYIGISLFGRTQTWTRQSGPQIK